MSTNIGAFGLEMLVSIKKKFPLKNKIISIPLYAHTHIYIYIYIYIYMSQAQKQVWKRNDDTSYFLLIWLIGTDAGEYADDRRQIVCACTVAFLPK